MNRLDLFPDTTTLTRSGLNIGGCDLPALAEEFGTPLYVYDRATMDAAVGLYRTSLAEYYPTESGLTYAGKAYLCLAVAQWTRQQGLWVDCTGQGEIGIAAAAGVERSQLLVHGVNKNSQDLQAAIDHAGTIVVDNPAELELLASLAQSHPLPDLWLRYQPGLAVETHAHTQTGQSGSKFGMERETVLESAAFCRQHKLRLRGLHFHLGSQFKDPQPLKPAIGRALDLAKEIGFNADWTLSPGGGWGVAYHEEDLPQPDVKSYIRLIAESVAKGCEERGMKLPRLQLEPGRSLVARAGVAVYRVGAVKQMGKRTWALLDGGLADNPRRALYGAKYSALLVNRPDEPNKLPVCLAGPYCESGDVLAMDLPMPEIRCGDLVALPVSGAYHLSMASNYNGAFKPAVAWLDGGQARLIQERENLADLLRRDHPL